MEGDPRAAAPRSSLPANYVSLAQLQERWRKLDQEHQKKREEQEEEAVPEEIQKVNAEGDERREVRPPAGRWRQKRGDVAAASGEAEVKPDGGGRDRGRRRSSRRGPPERGAAGRSPNAEAGGEEEVDRVDRRRDANARGKEKEKEIPAKPVRALERETEKRLENVDRPPPSGGNGKKNPKARGRAVVRAAGPGGALEREPEKKLENVDPPPLSPGNGRENPKARGKAIVRGDGSERRKESSVASEGALEREREPEKKLENVDRQSPSRGKEEEKPKHSRGDFKSRASEWRRVKILPAMVDGAVEVAQKLEKVTISVPREDGRSSRRPTGARRAGSHLLVWIKKTEGAS